MAISTVLKNVYHLFSDMKFSSHIFYEWSHKNASKSQALKDIRCLAIFGPFGRKTKNKPVQFLWGDRGNSATRFNSATRELGGLLGGEAHQKRLKKLRLRRHRFTVISRGATMKTSFDTANKSISLCNVKFSRHVEPDKTCKKKSQEAVPKMTCGEFGDDFRSRILLWNVRICLSIIK